MLVVATGGGRGMNLFRETKTPLGECLTLLCGPSRGGNGVLIRRFDGAFLPIGPFRADPSIFHKVCITKKLSIVSVPALEPWNHYSGSKRFSARK